MKLFDNLKRVVALFRAEQVPWAICGGIAACLYRAEPRFTGDIDIALLNSTSKRARETAEQLARALGYDPIAGYVTDKDGNLISEVALIAGRESREGSYVGIDLLLPVLPWVERAVVNAQANCLDYGFDRCPTITPEDLIIAKLYAIAGTPQRPYDLDDIRSIMSAQTNLNQDYLERSARELGLKFPL